MINILTEILTFSVLSGGVSCSKGCFRRFGRKFGKCQLFEIIDNILTETLYNQHVEQYCAGSSNNLVPRVTKVSAIDVTLNVFFERLYWFQDWPHLSSESTVRVLPHPHCSIENYISISVQCFRMCPSFFVSTRPGTLPRDEGTGNWPDWWIVMTKKMRGHPGKTIALKSRNSCRWNGRECVCIGTVNSSRNSAQS